MLILTTGISNRTNKNSAWLCTQTAIFSSRGSLSEGPWMSAPGLSRSSRPPFSSVPGPIPALLGPVACLQKTHVSVSRKLRVVVAFARTGAERFRHVTNGGRPGSFVPEQNSTAIGQLRSTQKMFVSNASESRHVVTIDRSGRD